MPMPPCADESGRPVASLSRVATFTRLLACARALGRPPHFALTIFDDFRASLRSALSAFTLFTFAPLSIISPLRHMQKIVRLALYMVTSRCLIFGHMFLSRFTIDCFLPPVHTTQYFISHDNTLEMPLRLSHGNIINIAERQRSRIGNEELYRHAARQSTGPISRQPPRYATAPEARATRRQHDIRVIE